MIFSKQIFSSSLKSLKLTSIIGLGSFLITQGLICGELHASPLIPTSYHFSELSPIRNREVPKGYVKANYKIDQSDPSKGKSGRGTPTLNKDLSAEAAAEIMAQEIFRLFHINLSNETIHIGFYPANNFYTSNWKASLSCQNPSSDISIAIDSVTGELLHADSTQCLSGSFSETPDDKGYASSQAVIANAQKNKAAYCEKAKQLITASGILLDSLSSCEYKTSSCSTQMTGQKENGHLITHYFTATDASGKVYEFTLSKDLTQIVGIEMPTFVAQSNAEQQSYTN